MSMETWKKRFLSGWTYREEDLPHRSRRDETPVEFHAEEIPGDPLSPAWGDPDYVDPDLSHRGLPLGTRYWQGMAKPITRRGEERAMSPEWVAEHTEEGETGGEAEQFSDEDPSQPDPEWPRVVRPKARDVFWLRPDRLWPG